ncbi:hypothetical protein RCCWILLIS_97 [Rhodobacter phage RcCWillis]|nr:hypothetical protein RCCWILLIS_97 [Rhodobacter phage RcCWillis]
MTQKIAYYQIMVGLPGCLPNSHEFRAWPTRGEMTQGISEILDTYGFSQRNRRQINIAETWQYIQRGGKRGNFVIRGNMGNPCNAEFVQISAAEYRAAESDSDW